MKLKKIVFFYLLFPFIVLGADSSHTIPKLSVRGEATVFKPADQMELTIGVVTQAKETATAVQENNQKMNQVIENLQKIGVNSSDYRTGQFRVQPIYRSLPKETGHSNHQVIDSYEVLNSIQIKTQKLHLADQIINTATRNGANQLDHIEFNLSNPQGYRAEAIQAAMQNALLDAEALAQAAKVRLVQLLDVSLDQQLPNRIYRSLSMDKMSSAETTPVESGNVEVKASVEAIFEIAPNF